MSLTFWPSLPPDIRAALLHAGVGRLHLYETSHRIFESLGKEGNRQDFSSFYSLGCDVLLAAWESSPCNTSLAVTLLQLHAKQAFLPPAIAAVLTFYSRLPPPDPELEKRFDFSILHDLNQWYAQIQLEQRNNSAPINVVERAVNVCLRHNQLGWLFRIINKEGMLPKPIKLALMGDIYFAEERWEEAAQSYAEAQTHMPLITWQTRQAECLHRAGKYDEALLLWQDAHQKRPWNVNILLRLSDVLAGRDKTPAGPPPGRGAVLLYTWNKGVDMDATLASVAASDLGENKGANSAVRIFVLDNGSTDSSPEVFRKWEAHFAGRLAITTLPVNVGAPSARNWLLSLPEVRAADWAAFLDDDVQVPSNWLGHLWAGIEAYPAAGVAGGHAVDFHAPMVQQWTDMHIIPLNSAQSDDAFQDSFRFSGLHKQAYDFGDFNFMRPCVTAIGCCHMFTRKAMDEGGTFDIRFSPSQSDDVDHDMRRGLRGQLPVYNGHLRVLHKRSTGYHRTPDRRNWASITGNWFKLQASYSREEVQSLYETDQQILLNDVLQRIITLGKG